MVVNGGVQVFIWGALGPIVVELAKLSQMREGRIPKLYSNPRYWLLSIPLVLLGGLAAIANGTEDVRVWTALQLGATAPLVFAAIASGRYAVRSRGAMPDMRRPSVWELLHW